MLQSTGIIKQPTSLMFLQLYFNLTGLLKHRSGASGGQVFINQWHLLGRTGYVHSVQSSKRVVVFTIRACSKAKNTPRKTSSVPDL